MWKKISCAALACVLWMAFAAVGMAETAMAAAVPAEKPERIELVLVLDKSGSMQGAGVRHDRRVQLHDQKTEGT